MTLASQIASDLLDIKAVYLKPEEPFTWASGIKSPIYTDNRITLSYPETRTLIENGFVEKIKEEFPEVEVIVANQKITVLVTKSKVVWLKAKKWLLLKT